MYSLRKYLKEVKQEEEKESYDFSELHFALDELRTEDFSEKEMGSKLQGLEDQLEKLTL